MSAVVPLTKLTTRATRRGFNKEINKVHKHLVSIETEFVYAIFNAPKSVSYLDIYKYFLDEWNNLTKRLLLIYDFRYIAINLHHFPNLYKPQL